METQSADPFVGHFAELFPEDNSRVVRAVGIVSLDGFLTRGGRSGSLGGEADARLMSYLRRSADVVLVGASTAAHEHYSYPLLREQDRAWREEQGLAPEPPIALVSRSQTTPARSQFPPDRVTVVPAPQPSTDLNFGLAALLDVQRSGAKRIIVEGGPTIWKHLMEAGALDEFSLTLSPHFVGDDAEVRFQAAPSRDLLLLNELPIGSFIFTRYRVD